ncbi:flagellar protein FlaG [candidate division KSB1 bacterium]|nr:flagellar protein FlaG [candidate division KSB1 bacterium]
MQVGELDRTVTRNVGDNLFSRMVQVPGQPTDVKEVDKNTAQYFLKEEIEKNKTSQPKDEHTALNENELNKTIEELNKHFQMFNTRLSFSFNDESDMAVIKIQDRNSGEVIKQVPPQEMLDSLSKISSIVGILIDKMM